MKIKPFMTLYRRNSVKKLQEANQSIEVLIHELLEQLRLKSYGEDTLNNYHRIFKKLILYMYKNKISSYSSKIGDSFIEDYVSTHAIGDSFRNRIKTVIGRLSDYSDGKKYSLQRKKTPSKLPENYSNILENYLSLCKQNGNRTATINGKRKFCGDFLNCLMTLGCYRTFDIESTDICKACLMLRNKDSWAVIRMFLKYLYHEHFIEHDYSTIIPNYTKPFVMPTIYSEKEIHRFENSIDRSTKTGIRDYAALLLATRLGMRSGDITCLTFDDIDFESNSIHLIQEKTLQPLELPLLPEIKSSIQDYIKNVRPLVNDRHIFLRRIAPYEPITTSVLRFAATKYFHKADIDVTGKKHGIHTFRSSLASSMVNDQIPYDVVRKVLGHTDPDAIKHYARVDIESLREYSIPVPEPSSAFKAFLNGECSYDRV